MAVPHRVLYLQSTSEISGTDLTLLRTVEVLDRSQFEPHVVLNREGPLTREYERAGCRVHLVPSMRQFSFQRGLGYLLQCLQGYPLAVRELVRLIRRESISLVHTNTIHNPYGFAAAFLSRRPHIWHVREIVVESRLVRWLEILLVGRMSARFIVMDDAIGAMFRRNGALPSNLVKLYDGVDLAEFHPEISGSRIRKDLGLDDHTPLVGTVGRLAPVKGPDLFLETASAVLKTRPNCHFLVCGGEILGHEGYEETLRETARRLGILDRVHLTGWRYRYRDIPEVYGALDICLQCPRQPEPYGLWCVEAMASGVPIVTFAEGGPAELCVHGETALLISPGDTAAASLSVLELLENPLRAQTLGAAARRRAEALFDRRRSVKNLEMIYKSVLLEKAPSP